jgi:hypothetical protein
MESKESGSCPNAQIFWREIMSIINTMKGLIFTIKIG